MRNVFDVWVEKELDHAGRLTYRRTLWLQSRRIGSDFPAGVLAGVAVRPLISGVMAHTPQFDLWLNYAHRTARGWNLLRLAAELLDLPTASAPYLLADLCWEAGEHHLAAELLDLFGPSQVTAGVVRSGTVPYPPPDVTETGELGYVVV